MTKKKKKKLEKRLYEGGSSFPRGLGEGKKSGALQSNDLVQQKGPKKK